MGKSRYVLFLALLEIKLQLSIPFSIRDEH